VGVHTYHAHFGHASNAADQYGHRNDGGHADAVIGWPLTMIVLYVFEELQECTRFTAHLPDCPHTHTHTHPCSLMCDEWIIASVTYGCVGADCCVALCVDDVDVDTAELAFTGSEMVVSFVCALLTGVGATLAVTFMCPVIGTPQSEKDKCIQIMF